MQSKSRFFELGKIVGARNCVQQTDRVTETQDHTTQASNVSAIPIATLVTGAGIFVAGVAAERYMSADPEPIDPRYSVETVVGAFAAGATAATATVLACQSCCRSKKKSHSEHTSAKIDALISAHAPKRADRLRRAQEVAQGETFDQGQPDDHASQRPYDIVNPRDMSLPEGDEHDLSSDEDSENSGEAAPAAASGFCGKIKSFFGIE